MSCRPDSPFENMMWHHAVTGGRCEEQGRATNCRSVRVPRSGRHLLGMRVNAWTGFKTQLGQGPQIKNSVDQRPDGLLLHENFIMSLIPLHLGMHQYWRDFDALEAWARSTPHHEWWRDFLRSSRGTGFWHEAYFMRGGMEAVYDDVPVAV